MWTRRGSAKLAASLALWGLAGVALVLLPGLLAQSPSKSAETPVVQNPRTLLFPATTSSTSTGTAAPSNGTGTDFFVRLLILLIPAIALSTIGGTWVSGRVRRAAV